MFVTASLSGQEYQSSIGFRLGSPVSLSFKTFIGDDSALEFFANYRSESLGSVFNTNYRWTAIGLGGAYQIHNPIDAVDGLYWYYGGGVSAYFWTYSDEVFFEDNSSLSFGLQGYLGLDYAFANAPVNLSLDWVPTYFINGYVSGFGADYGALSVRYIFAE
jgi:hypothetical protein